MSISVFYFARLREQLGQSQLQCDPVSGDTPASLWARLNEENLPDNVLVAVNQHYVKRDQPLSDGDEVAYFPPVTGG